MFRWLPLRLWRLCGRFGLNLRRCGHRRAAVEIGDRTDCFRRRRRSEFVGDRSGETVFRSVAAPAASAATSATPGAPLAILSLIGARDAGLFVAFLVVGFAIVGNRAIDGFGRNAHDVLVLARRTAFTRLATATAPATPF